MKASTSAPEPRFAWLVSRRRCFCSALTSSRRRRRKRFLARAAPSCCRRLAGNPSTGAVGFPAFSQLMPSPPSATISSGFGCLGSQEDEEVGQKASPSSASAAQA
eukprot:CAMPEP_0180563816 /NCGR_PEP_ID=MMETSP1037_2-20121125/4680_1 /TAXON_ID=632150 /ORGANISM="Azadinium spinosum, Strain 3D9" /LENGTH=104 /DNA_ID=CAMNT_0022580677 /DNA_START=320 /DNA_END=631 /DNA_ORIENTATION=-